MLNVETKILHMYQAWSADKGLVRVDFIKLVMDEFNWDRETATKMSAFLNSWILEGGRRGRR